MKLSWLRGLTAALVCIAAMSASQVQAGGAAGVAAGVAVGACVDAGANKLSPPLQRRVQRYNSWHYNYYDPAWGPAPHALVVPPNACSHVEYNWGVCGTQKMAIRHQFLSGMRNMGGGAGAGGTFLQPAPVQPSSTNQMGVYYIRAPR